MSLRERIAVARRPDQPLYECEQALLDPVVRRSTKEVEALLHQDFMETGSSGDVYDRDSMISMMVDQSPGDVVIVDFETTHLSADVALVTYRSVGMGGQEARRTSIWVQEDGRWQLRHHQGTRVPNRWGQVS